MSTAAHASGRLSERLLVSSVLWIGFGLDSFLMKAIRAVTAAALAAIASL
jgi:ABC-type Zn2+ transport system substrate-binding protein/surface adhesin